MVANKGLQWRPWYYINAIACSKWLICLFRTAAT